MGSLQGFQVLKKIRVEYRTFVEDGPRYLASGIRTHQIIYVLPASVESVTLTGPMLSYMNMAKTVKGLANHKAKTVPKLEEVFYESCKSS